MKNTPINRLFAAVLLPLAICIPITQAAPTSQPNIVLIMCDDAGFADFGYSGGIADTPVLDKLASEGMRFTRAYSNARCMPTRGSLMTGLNPQQVGGGDSRLNGECVTIAEVLKEAGYATYMVGKWHLGWGEGWRRPTIDAATGLLSTPIGRGFDRFYGIWDGAAAVNKPKLMRSAEGDGAKKAPRIIQDDRPLAWEEVPDDYYNTTTWTDKAIGFIKDTPKDKPLFLYVAHTAPHWPLDPKPESIAKYEGRFAEGWDVLRQRILDNQKKMGLIPDDFPLPPLERIVPPFSKEAAEKLKYEIGSETYYASITEMDTEIGRLMEALRETGRVDNTLLVFLSDNGADSLIGGPPRGQVSNTPFMGNKLTYYEGGAITPLFVWWPGHVAPGAINRKQQVMLEDHMATFLEVSGAAYPEERHGQKIHPLAGRSYLNALKDPQKADPDRVWCWEHDGQRGVLAGEWRAVFVDRRHPVPKELFVEERDGWNLYRMQGERNPETEELSASHPEKLQEMIGIWREWAKRVKWSPGQRFGPHPSDAANGIGDFSERTSNKRPANPEADSHDE